MVTFFENFCKRFTSEITSRMSGTTVTDTVQVLSRRIANAGATTQDQKEALRSLSRLESPQKLFLPVESVGLYNNQVLEKLFIGKLLVAVVVLLRGVLQIAEFWWPSYSD